MSIQRVVMWGLLLVLLNTVVIEAQTGRFEFTRAVYKASIEETSKTNIYITSETKMGIYITDLELSSKIVYTIQGRESSTFKVDNAKQVGDFVFLRIHPKTTLNRERTPSWVLRVTARSTDQDDNTLETETEIQLTIEDINDLRPIFLGSSEPLNIREDTPVQTTICTVKASDADSGTNADIYYQFLEDTEYFVIHPTSGGISLTRPLRPHREKAEYSLLIQAQDRGGNDTPRTSTTSINIKVVEVNYFSPIITVDSLEKLTLDSQIGKVIALLTVNDDDLGENGGIRSVLLSGDYRDHFEITKRDKYEDSYAVTIAKDFPSDLPLSFTLSVVATDSGGPPKSSSKRITVEQSNKQIPYFAQKFFEITVSELVPMDAPIFTVASEQVLSSNNIRPQYNIAAGNKRSSFNINPATGYLSAAKALNRERFANFNLTIRTSNDPSNIAFVGIKVKDENDNFPVFQKKRYEATVEENLPINSPVIQVSATDDDDEENGYVSYSIANLEPVPFQIDPFTGHINTTMVLDYETMRKNFRLHIRASDWGSPFRREAEVDVLVTLKGVNDNQPMFEKSYCSGTISRDIRNSNEVAVFSAIDFDGDTVSFSIVSGNVDDLFSIDKSTGTLSLKREIQNSDTNVYNLRLMASDAPSSAGYLWVNVSIINGRNANNRKERKKTVTIDCESSDALKKQTDMISKSTKANAVIDEPMDDFTERFGRNDFDPEFDAGFPSTFNVLENTPRGSTIVDVIARDRDPGFNGMLVYAISSGNDNFPFHLDHKSGVLSILTPPDRERRVRYDLSITVTDLGRDEKSAKKDITINILDVNDNSPTFVRENYSTFLEESEDVGNVVLQVSANDLDAGSNGDIRYSIQTDNDNFLIDAVNGNISIATALDRESIPVHELRVVATDSSESAPLSSTVTVTVTVQDINDNTPRCIPEDYTVRMLEDLPTRVLVIDVEAIDEDEGANGDITYSLKRGGEGKFTIDSMMGTIRLAEKLDYETQQVYSLLVEVKDSGSPRKKATCSVQVEVIDVNENVYAPSFGGRYYMNGSVEENVPINTKVMKVTAEDQDSGRDGEVTYSIRNGSGLGRFTIDSEGVIRTASPLDRESTPHYWLTIYAQDKGAVPLHSTIEAYIEILDVNDNSPQPLLPVYYAEVAEKSPVGRSVIKVTAEDLDSSSNQQLEFSIIDILNANNDKVNGVFTIDPTTGLITTLDGNLDREATDGYSLEVGITDNGVPPMSTVAMVIVKVTDLNDNKPRFTKNYYNPKIPAKNKTSESIPIFRVFATDTDAGPNAELSYFITQGNDNQRFSLDAKTGVLSTRKALDASVRYPLLSLAVLDTGTPKQKKGTAKISLTVFDSPDNSPNPPEFMWFSPSVEVQEKLEIGKLVDRVVAEDPDGDELYYKIIDGDPTSTFCIDPNNGVIQLALPLDWEVNPNYDLTITVTDGTHTIEQVLRVNILDSNDNAPEFDKTEYEVITSENTPVTTNILKVTATDRDSASFLSYTVLDNTDSARERLFTVDGRTGTIAVAKRLDHENRKTHTLNIMAQDHGTPTKSAYARVVIRVTDFNDHAPSCHPEGFSGRVYESAAPGTQILQVTAVDLDKGDNAKLSYNIESGNPDNDFSIMPAFGYISVGAELDRSKKSFYQMVVRVQDHGVPIKSCTCNVNITVTISDNAPPKFLIKEYMENVYENLPARTPVVVAEAVSQSSVVYEIINGNEANHFEVNPSTGVVSTLVPLDYEAQTVYNITVQATNMVGLSAIVFVIVHVEDVNDNAPEFLYTMYQGNITESKPPNSPILDSYGRPLVISAQDEDNDHNAHLLYQIIEIEAQKYFKIDANTGAIRSKVLLDHEERSQFKFTVQVRDSGEPQLQCINPVDVLVTIVDINDSPPVFDKNVYDTLLVLPTYKDVAVVTVHATDADTASITSLEYSITAGDPEKRFSINSLTGTITVVNTTNLMRNYVLTVTVSDGMNKGTTEVRISVQQALESELRFAKDSYSAAIIENDPTIKILALVSAVGNALNEPLEYRILNPDKMFNISKTSGILRTMGIPFDREAKQEYTIVVEVSDTRVIPRRAHVLVNIKVLDENDNVPMFVHVDYKAVVQVEAEVGSIVRKVIAIDHDIGRNGEVKYSLVDGGDNRFNINATSGEIMLVKKLDPGNQNEDFILRIKASDKGTKKHSSVVDVPISVINKAMPVFEQPQYTKTIAEDIQLHTAILHIQATSPDGRKVIYSISGGDDFNQFVITNKTGALKVVGAMDFEVTQTFRLTVRASDTLTGAYAEVVVVITIEDINDIRPIFEVPEYTNTLSEAVAVGTSVANVKAYDYDAGKNGVVMYQIVEDGSMTDSFYIDSYSGSILTSRVLDYESIQNHNFLVRAVDGGVPQLSSETRITVKVTDLNDNPPEFTRPNYEATISELAGKGAFVCVVAATDPDVSDIKKLTYTIISGNDEMNFYIGSRTGIISITNTRQPNLNPNKTYILNISVSDTVFTNNAYVVINVDGTNQYAPMFTMFEYSVSLDENQSIGTTVTHVSASDDDEGTGGIVSYSIIGEDMESKFIIDATTGEITTASVFDRENPTQRTMSIPIMAIDKGHRASFSSVKVILEDTNDNHPTFEIAKYEAYIYPDMQVEEQVLQVYAVDADKDQNARLTYSIFAGVNDRVTELFKINSADGSLLLKAPLTGRETNVFQFFVQAVDGGEKPLRGDAQVEVYILTRQDVLPIFVDIIPQFSINENAQVGTIVDVVTAIHNETLIYSIVPGNLIRTNNRSKFSVNNKGEVLVNTFLDYETCAWYTLTIKATTDTIPSLASFKEVRVDVKDVNDNAPRFESSNYDIKIPENAPVDYSVLRVHAYDKDTTSQIEYSLSNELNDVSEIFSIDSETGWITTNIELDRETKPIYHFTVKARHTVDEDDEVEANVRSAVASVTVNVMDVNDSPPRFTSTLNPVTVPEDIEPPFVIIKVSADDADDKMNAMITYHIAGGDPFGQFLIDSNTGKISTTKMLDREFKKKYVITIIATDGVFFDTTNVTVLVGDVNDNAPVCIQMLYSELFIESLGVSSYIVEVWAEDADASANSRITFTLFGEGAEDFNIGSESGILRTAALLDRETRSKYLLKVNATDGGGLSCTSDLIISLMDDNDNPPIFEPTIITEAFSENTPTGSLLTRVQAIDPDEGTNRQFVYSFIDSAGGMFGIDRKLGIISLLKGLDREFRDTYNLTIQATDTQKSEMSSIAYLVVKVLDEDDNAPIFEYENYHVNVSEDVDVGASISKVLATSEDIEVITYSITGGNEHGKFNIHPDSGLITVADTLDFEESREFYLTIQASDNGQQQQIDIATVNIIILDANDNKPYFSQQIYNAVINEASQVGDSIVQVLATDQDSGDFGKVQYKIVRQNLQGEPKFEMNEKDGLISLAALVDREEMAAYTITVRAIDGGSPPMSTDVSIQVIISDINDNSPRFSKNNYTVVILEETFPVTNLKLLEVSDLDSLNNGPPFMFEITQGNEEGLFGITETGMLQAVKHISQKEPRTVRIVVRATDSGTPSLSEETYVNVIITESTHPPVPFTPLQISINSFPEYFPAGFIGKVHATDSDSHDELEYAFVSEPRQFSVQSDSGKIFIKPKPQDDHYELNVSITDHKFIVYADVFVDVAFISQDMLDNAMMITVRGVSTEVFLFDYYAIFKNSLAGTFAFSDQQDVDADDIKVITIQESSSQSQRSRRSAKSQDVDVIFAVQHSTKNDVYLRPKPLIRLINSSKTSLGERMGIEVVSAYSDICQMNTCPKNARCKSKLIQDAIRPAIVASKRMSLVSVRMDWDVQCICKSEGECGTPAPPALAMSFSGNNFMQYTAGGNELFDRATFSSSIRTIQANGIIMYGDGNLPDFSLLEIKHGYVQYSFNCGSGEGVITIEQTKINDGEWHQVEVRRVNSQAFLTLDRSITESGTAPGNHEDVNIDRIYVGGKVVGDKKRTSRDISSVSNGFQGCMEDVFLNGQPLTASGDDVDPSAPGTCPAVFPQHCDSNPCQNQGQCTNLDFSYECKCASGWHGLRCEFRDSCIDDPCQNGGMCERIKDDFNCVCPGNEICTNFCASSPCLNGGLCTESRQGPKCVCNQFEGERCEFDIDECLSSPCNPGHFCKNLPGLYKCLDCSMSTEPECNEVSMNIKSSPLNFNKEEIIGGGLCIFIIIIIVIIFTLVVRRRRRRRYHDTDSNQPVTRLDNRHDYKRDKVSNLDVHHVVHNPPPVPIRPRSYTPSNHNSLNNLNDNERYYDSHDGQNVYQGLPVSQPPSLHPIPSNSDSDSIAKPHWDFDNRSGTGSFVDGKESHHNIPVNVPPIHQPPPPVRPPIRHPIYRKDADLTSMSSINTVNTENEEDNLPACKRRIQERLNTIKEEQKRATTVPQTSSAEAQTSPQEQIETLFPASGSPYSSPIHLTRSDVGGQTVLRPSPEIILINNTNQPSTPKSQKVLQTFAPLNDPNEFDASGKRNEHLALVGCAIVKSPDKICNAVIIRGSPELPNDIWKLQNGEQHSDDETLWVPQNPHISEADTLPRGTTLQQQSSEQNREAHELSNHSDYSVSTLPAGFKSSSNRETTFSSPSMKPKALDLEDGQVECLSSCSGSPIWKPQPPLAFSDHASTLPHGVTIPQGINTDSPSKQNCQSGILPILKKNKRSKSCPDIIGNTLKESGSKTVRFNMQPEVTQFLVEDSFSGENLSPDQESFYSEISHDEHATNSQTQTAFDADGLTTEQRTNGHVETMFDSQAPTSTADQGMETEFDAEGLTTRCHSHGHVETEFGTLERNNTARNNNNDSTGGGLYLLHNGPPDYQNPPTYRSNSPHIGPDTPLLSDLESSAGVIDAVCQTDSDDDDDEMTPVLPPERQPEVQDQLKVSSTPNFVDSLNIQCSSGYHWDCSDWMPPTLTKIHEDVTQKEVPDSPTNLSVNTTMSQMNEYEDDDVDDEYVGEDTDYPGDDDMPYPHTEEFQQQLQNYPPSISPDGSQRIDSMSDLPRQYYQHPNSYLPGHHMSVTSLPPSEYNGIDQSPKKRVMGVGSRGGDYERMSSNLDNASMSAYTSNASCSDVSGMYEPESEIGLSDCESATDDRFSTHLSNLTTDV
ncbi:protocadherin Fat 1-like isoform X2 [Antedon mediterranea]|uniref:protocadherin Fat 1-like isoform X2 n=1 Tax=Antedon mediterranea TaxID=105859 RepID=UPI003AF519FF